MVIDCDEVRILGALRGLLYKDVNKLLGEMELDLPPVERGDYSGGSAVVPVIRLSTCERSEKERIILVDAYTLSITFSVAEHPESELRCYAYAAAVEKALLGNPTLDGEVSRAAMTAKTFGPPKRPHCGEGWTVEIKIRVNVENPQGSKRGGNDG